MHIEHLLEIGVCFTNHAHILPTKLDKCWCFFGQGNLDLVREMSGNFAFDNLWDPCVTFFVCMSSEDSGQCAHVCTLALAFFMDAAWAFFMDAARYARMRTLARVFTARTHKECVHICACKYANMCTRSLCV